MRRRLCFIITLWILTLFAGALYPYVSEAESSSFEIHFIDVGQGDAAIILCDGESLMIDGGGASSSSLIFSYLRNQIGLSHIDFMIATHPHEDHIGGLAAALNACTVGVVYSPVTYYDSDAFRSLDKYVGLQELEFTVPSVGDSFCVGSASVVFLAPLHQYENTNDLSLVVKITYGDTSFLFTGDCEWESEHDMIDNAAPLESTLLKVGHHGSSSSSSYVFLREVHPQYAIISVGAGNSYGHPSEEVLSRLSDADIEVYRTDLSGTIICHSDGASLSFDFPRQARTNPVSSVETGDVMYIGNKKSKKFHYPTCESVADMSEKNKIELFSRDDAILQGYEPCKRCNP